MKRFPSSRVRRYIEVSVVSWSFQVSVSSRSSEVSVARAGSDGARVFGTECDVTNDFLGAVIRTSPFQRGRFVAWVSVQNLKTVWKDEPSTAKSLCIEHATKVRIAWGPPRSQNAILDVEKRRNADDVTLFVFHRLVRKRKIRASDDSAAAKKAWLPSQVGRIYCQINYFFIWKWILKISWKFVFHLSQNAADAKKDRMVQKRFVPRVNSWIVLVFSAKGILICRRFSFLHLQRQAKLEWS